MEQGGGHVRVRNFLHGEVTHKLKVQVGLVLLELGDGLSAVVDSQPVDQLLELEDFLLRDLDLVQQSDCFALLCRLRLPEVSHGSLTLLQRIGFRLVCDDLLLEVQLMLHDELATLQALKHTLQVQVFTLDPNVGFSVRISNLALATFKLLLEILVVGMSVDTLVVVVISIKGNADILVLDQLGHDFALTLIVRVTSRSDLFKRALLLLHDWDNFLEENEEATNLFRVVSHLVCAQLLVLDIESLAILLEHLQRSLALK